MQFSVVIPAYNAADTIIKCVNSIINQSFTDYEIYLINDGSNDNTLEICQGLMRNNSKIHVINQENQGPMLARFASYPYLKGDYVIHLDSDDVLCEGSLAALSSVVQINNPDVVLFKFNNTSDNDHDNFSYPISGSRFLGSDEIDILFNTIVEGSFCLNSLGTKLIRREKLNLIEDEIPKKKLLKGEDLLVSISILDQSQSIYFFDEPLYRYQRNNSSITTQYNSKYLLDDIEINSFLRKQAVLWEKRGYKRPTEAQFALQFLSELPKHVKWAYSANYFWGVQEVLEIIQNNKYISSLIEQYGKQMSILNKMITCHPFLWIARAFSRLLA